jgi:hypothetical protein
VNSNRRLDRLWRDEKDTLTVLSEVFSSSCISLCLN